MKIVAIMPLKLNNERLPGKNTKLLGDKPLLQYELDNLKQVNGIEDIYVYCSDETVVPLLPDGVKFLKRPAFLDLPTSNFTQIFENFMNTVAADIYVYAHATAPFISITTMQECLDKVVTGDFDSAFCASKIQDYLWQDNQPMNFDATNVPRSQDLKPVYRETSGVYVFTKDVFLNTHRRIGLKPYVKEVTFKEAIDINNPEDFELAQAMLNVKLAAEV